MHNNHMIETGFKVKSKGAEGLINDKQGMQVHKTSINDELDAQASKVFKACIDDWEDAQTQGRKKRIIYQSPLKSSNRI